MLSIACDQIQYCFHLVFLWLFVILYLIKYPDFGLFTDVEILNGLQWSAALDKTFMKNYENDPEILWQYFGSQSGFMRTLPGNVP